MESVAEGAMCNYNVHRVGGSGRLLPNCSSSTTTTGNNCQCHTACKDDNDDVGGGDGEKTMMGADIVLPNISLDTRLQHKEVEKIFCGQTQRRLLFISDQPLRNR